MLQKALRTAAVALALSAASCSSENTLVTISGKVTLDGAPLPDGDILFMPANPQFGSEAAKIKDGAYQAIVRPGQSKGQMRSSRPVPGKKVSMGEPLSEDFI